MPDRRLLRMARRADARREDPAALAEAVAAASIVPREGTWAPLAEPPPRLPAEAIRSLARRAFLPERRVLVFLSPFQG